MALQKDTLRNTTVLDSLFNDVKGIIIKIVIDNAFSNSVIFVRIFNYWFLEVSIELEDLYLKISYCKYNKFNS
jgi:hypothetical protein